VGDEDVRTEVERSPAAVEEVARVRAVEDLGLIGAGPEERFDRITRLAQQVFGVGAAAVTLIDGRTQHHKSQYGRALEDGPRATGFCDHTIRNEGILVVEDATADERFSDFPSVTSGQIRFYAGYPLEAPGGHRVGALCVVHDRPRDFTDADRRMLAELASWAQREIDRAEELDRAGDVQRALLPRETLRLPGYDIAGLCLQSGAVGGDFFDWYTASDGEVGLTVGDVMGKGLQAAILMATVRAVMRAGSRVARPAEAIAAAAAALHDDLWRTDTLVTLCHARLRPADGLLRLADAGHGLTLLVRADGSVERTERGGVPLGWPYDAEWPEHTLRLEPGDGVVIFSDGVLELYGGAQAAFREVAAVARTAGTADELVAHLGALAGALPVLPDDVTVVAVRRTA
jgi:stage II sporulation SpoE-like protein/GAF domain-containing protein